MTANKQKIAVACSGGSDSLALAIMAAEKYDVIALIIDHKLRKESAAEAKKTAAILKKLKIKNKILSAKSPKIKSNVQSAARKMRYGLLTDYCKKNKIKFLATAHHADDVAETVLLKISRGSGVDGLTGITENIEMDGIKIIRPLLRHTKLELENFLRAKKIKWIEDPTNNTDKYKRNSLRHALEKLEEPELLTQRLGDLAENMRRVRDFLESETAKAEKNSVSYKKNKADLDTEKFRELHDEIKFRLLVKIIMRLAKPEYRPRFEKLKNLKSAIEKGEVKTLSGLIFRPQKSFYEVTCEKG